MPISQPAAPDEMFGEKGILKNRRIFFCRFDACMFPPRKIFGSRLHHPTQKECSGRVHGIDMLMLLAITEFMLKKGSYFDECFFFAIVLYSEFYPIG